MALKIAINGFGRIGRLTYRALLEAGRDELQLVAVNDLAPADMSAHLLKYDSVHGTLANSIEAKDGSLVVDGQSIPCLAVANPAELPWDKLGVDLVLECTGRFSSKETASAHLAAGAKAVLVSAPCKEADKTIVFGVNHGDLGADDRVVSNASCTTNCLAPVAHLLQQGVGIERGFMTTIHAYTGDQRLIDTAHKDPRRARAGALSMIPTSTGAAKAIGLVLPELAGRLDGNAVRVPTANASMVDLTFDAGRDTSVEEINALVRAGAEGALKGVLAVNDLPLVSCDFNHSAVSSTFDATQTQVVDGRFVRVVSWYDNEWGFSNRMLDTSLAMAKALGL